MQIKITFLGATRNVTGSRYLVEANDKRIVIDCGLYQERQYRERDWNKFPVPPDTIDAVLLTHAHLDHCGMIPRLFRMGCNSPIYCTLATTDLAQIVLMDSAELQQEDAEFKRKRHQKEGRVSPHPYIPLYTTEDVTHCLPFFTSVKYEQNLVMGNGIETKFFDAGHILGSSIIEMTIKQNNEYRKILFSGDLGRWGSPILRDPTTFKQADYIIIESTYGNRLHEDRQQSIDRLASIINDTVKAGGNVVIPSFVIERAQDVLYYLNDLLNTNRIPHLAIFVDSPMAVEVTKVFKKHTELYDEEMEDLIAKNKSFFDFSRLYMVKTVEESKAINYIRGTIVIMAGSGMCTGGRIKHHLVTNISRPESTILFVGYQAQATLGRLIVDGASKVRILGEEHSVRARIEQIDGFSAHADKNELQKWLYSLEKPPKHLFITHGEPEASQSFAELVKNKTGWNISVPEYLEEVTLD